MRPVSRRRCWPPGGTSRNGKGSVSTPAGRPRPTTPAGARTRPRRWRPGWRPADPVGIDEVWRLAAVGFDEDGRAADYEQVVSPEEWIGELLRTDLTVGSTTFTDTAVDRGGGSSTGPGCHRDHDRTDHRVGARRPAGAGRGDRGRPALVHQPGAARRRGTLRRRRHPPRHHRTDRSRRRWRRQSTARPTLGADQAAAVSPARRVGVSR